MKNWKLAYKITFWNCLIVIIIGVIAGLFTASASEFALAFGLVCLAGGFLDLLIGVILLIAGVSEKGKGFLNSAGILLLLSGISCGTGLSNLNFH